MVFLLLSGLKCSEGQMNIVREMKWCSVQEYGENLFLLFTVSE